MLKSSIHQEEKTLFSLCVLNNKALKLYDLKTKRNEKNSNILNIKWKFQNHFLSNLENKKKIT